MQKPGRIAAAGLYRLACLLEHFRFPRNRGNAPSPCFYAIPDGNRYALFVELLYAAGACAGTFAARRFSMASALAPRSERAMKPPPSTRASLPSSP